MELQLLLKSFMSFNCLIISEIWLTKFEYSFSLNQVMITYLVNIV